MDREGKGKRDESRVLCEPRWFSALDLHLAARPGAIQCGLQMADVLVARVCTSEHTQPNPLFVEPAWRGIIPFLIVRSIDLTTSPPLHRRRSSSPAWSGQSSAHVHSSLSFPYPSNAPFQLQESPLLSTLAPAPELLFRIIPLPPSPLPGNGQSQFLASLPAAPPQHLAQPSLRHTPTRPSPPPSLSSDCHWSVPAAP